MALIYYTVRMVWTKSFVPDFAPYPRRDCEDVRC